MIQAIVTDIEGTTSSLSFVKDVLFPYSRRAIAGFVKARAAEPAVAVLLDQARAAAVDPVEDLPALIAQLERWIDEDRKITPLKTLQGMIWEEGYRQGEFQGHVYEDAARNLHRWHERGLELYVFSSGSVQAQKLLFAHTPFGDLTPLFRGYFDTNVGQKRDPAAYRSIANAIGRPPGEILFLSDIREELEAAAIAGMRVVWVVRGEAPGGADIERVGNFDAIRLAA